MMLLSEEGISHIRNPEFPPKKTSVTQEVGGLRLTSICQILIERLHCDGMK